MSLAASKLQQRRQDRARDLRGTQSFLSEHKDIQIRHDWESRTQKRIEQNKLNNITQQLLQQDEDELNQRKSSLKSLYNGEMSEWKETLQSSLEVTQEDRIEQIRSRALFFKEKRETERKSYVNECYERQWRDAQDDIRGFDSAATLDRITKDRELMIKNKKIIEEQKQQRSPRNEIAATSLIQKDESVDHSQRKHDSLEIKRTLDHQVECKRSQAESLTRHTQLEEQEQLRQLAILEQQARERNTQSIEKARQGGDEILQKSRLRAKEREVRNDMERTQNLILLNHAMDIERKQIQAEQAKKEGGKEAATEYVQCIRHQAEFEEKENEHINRIRSTQQERLQKINDDKMLAEREMKRRWMADVDISRQEQIRTKQLESKTMHMEMDQYVAYKTAALLREEEADTRDAERAHAQRMENMLENKVNQHFLFPVCHCTVHIILCLFML